MPVRLKTKDRGVWWLPCPSLLLLLAATLGAASSFALGQETEPAEAVGRDTCEVCHELSPAFLHTPHRAVECEDCHGPGSLHVEAGGDLSLSLELLPAIESAQRCLGCHGTSHRVSGFRNSPHGRNNVSCLQCHSAHPDRPGLQLVKAAPNDLCVQCHQPVQANFRKPFHHPVLEGAMQCVDCHNPHVWELGKNEQLVVGVKESCVSCHSEKRGPFVFEHPPQRVNGCQQCHQPHGAFNSKMLKRTQVHQLCLECHSMTPNIAVAQPPAFHDIRSSRFRNCTLCHREIHGSNAHRAFLR